MAHATSLGKTVAASGICAQWPRDTFRLIINVTGDALTITAAGHQASRAGETAWPRQARHVLAGESAPAPAARPVPAAAGPARVMSGQVGPGEFYRLLAGLGSARRMRDCWAGDCPSGGVYFFFEDGEVRGDDSSRVVRVGTHALTAASKPTLWDRLRQHRGHLAGRDPGSGNHRASVFRRHVGAALIQHDGQPPPGLMASWLDRHGPHPGWASQETAVEMAVSRHIGAMRVFWLCVPDPGTPRACRAEQHRAHLPARCWPGPGQPRLARAPRHPRPDPPVGTMQRRARHATLRPRLPARTRTANPAASVNTVNQPIRGMSAHSSCGVL